MGKEKFQKPGKAEEKAAKYRYITTEAEAELGGICEHNLVFGDCQECKIKIANIFRQYSPDDDFEEIFLCSLHGIDERYCTICNPI